MKASSVPIHRRVDIEWRRVTSWIARVVIDQNHPTVFIALPMDIKLISIVLRLVFSCLDISHPPICRTVSHPI